MLSRLYPGIHSEKSVHEDGGVREPSDGYLETLAVYRMIAERMPNYGTLLIHGSCVAMDGMSYLFCAPSCTGKSTHARLWRELLGKRAVMVNDDKPLIHVNGDGTVVAYGTPWDGKHHLSSNVSVPLRAVCLLERSERNWIRRIDATEAYPAFLGHTYRPFDPVGLSKTLTLLDGWYGSLPCGSLGATWTSRRRSSPTPP